MFLFPDYNYSGTDKMYLKLGVVDAKCSNMHIIVIFKVRSNDKQKL